MAPVTEAPATVAVPADEPFVTLAENEFAAAAVERLGEADADGPGRLVFIYGPAGCGKSHLVRGFLGRVRSEGLRVAHLTASGLIAEIDEAIEGGVLHELRARLLGLDLFVCEDLAAVERRGETQRLLVAVIDETLAAGGRVLLTGSKAPGEMEGVSARLVDRFHAGVCAGIAPPGATSRAKLLAAFAEVWGLSIPADVLEFLADGLAVSPRELKAAVARLGAMARAEGSEVVDRELAGRLLGEVVAPPGPGLPEIAKAVARQFDVTVGDLRSGGRTAATSLPRQVAMSLAREITGQPLERIAGYFGRQNHGTVIHARKKLIARMEEDAGLRRRVAQIRRRLGVASR